MKIFPAEVDFAHPTHTMDVCVPLFKNRSGGENFVKTVNFF